MASQTFVIGDAKKKDVCIRFLLVAIMLGVITVAIVVGIYAFKTNEGDPNGKACA